ncbi:helix-turn-helix domain-containing protein [Streptomyces sp. NPDC050619]|uniref:TetR/AcrR family transcriptional regulator n=1 Tax=Streptomyces sp. NPDC050619 TaxID=3157214 RepID=UPI0034334FE4
MKPVIPADEQRPRRADARRNYDRLVAVAKTAFSEQGADAPLDDIAKRAGVGQGTLYRHFPHRDALLAAVIGESIDALHARAEELLRADDPDWALLEWLRAAVAHAGTYQGLAASMMSSMYDEGSALRSSCDQMHAAGAQLMERAQRQGSARPEFDAADLFQLIAAVAWVTERSADGGQAAERLLPAITKGLLADG